MKKKYDFSKGTKRADRIKKKSDLEAVKIPTSIRLDGALIAWFKTEAHRMGMPYQTLIASILHRYAHGELLDKEEVTKMLNKVS